MSFQYKMNNKRDEKKFSHYSIFPKSKRGQGLSINAIILIVLGIVVLVFLILGFALGWGNLRDKVFSSNNVNTISQGCQTSCLTGAEFDYCSAKRELKADGINLKDVTCNYLAQKQPRYEIETCPSVSCNVIISDTVSEEGAKGDCKLNTVGKTIQYFDAAENTLISLTCTAPGTVSRI